MSLLRAAGRVAGLAARGARFVPGPIGLGARAIGIAGAIPGVSGLARRAGGAALRRLGGAAAAVPRRGVAGRMTAAERRAMGLPVRRRRGITAAEIRGFKKLARLLSSFGMRPRGLARPMRRGRSPFSRARFGDGE